MIQKEMMVYAKCYSLFKILGWITALQIINLLANILIAVGIAAILSKMFSQQALSISSSFYLFGVLIVIIKGLCHYYSTKLTHYTSHELKYKLRRELLEKLLSLSPQQITQLQISKISQLSVEGIENIDIYYSRYLPQLFYSLLAPILLFITLAFIHWKITLFLLISMCAIPVAIVAAVKIGKQIFHSYWNKYLNVGKKFVEGVQGLHTLKMYDGDQEYQQLMNKESEDFRVMTMKVLRMQLQSITIMDLVSYLGTAVGIVFTIIAYRNDHLTLFGFICFAILAVEFFVPMRLLGSYFHVGLNGMSALKLLTSILEMRSETSKKLSTEPLDGEIHIQDVSYTYPDKSSSFTLNPCTFTIKKGELIGIVGQSGSGKTTISQLLQGFIQPSTGTITIGHKNMKNISPEVIHEYIGSVSNHSHIFEGTIFTNLQMGCSTLTEKQAIEMLQFVKLHEFCAKLHAPVQSEGINLSSGQRQKLAIARMLVKNPSVIIFDEATANIDQQSEYDIFQMIKDLQKQGKTIIVITHYLPNIIHSDEILVFNQGSLVEIGKHYELLIKEGIYAHLYKEQHSLEVNAS